MQEIHIFVSGTVQGVGFRWVVKRHAMLYDIKGYVRNLSDGRVEICAQGNRSQIDQFVELIQTRPGNALISHLETKYQPSFSFFSSFELR